MIFLDNHFNFLLYFSGVTTIPTHTVLHKPRYQHHQKDWKSGISLQLKLHRDHYIHSKDLFQQVVKHIYHSAEFRVCLFKSQDPGPFSYHAYE